MSLRGVVPAGTFHSGVGTAFLISEKVPCVYLCKDTVDDFMHTFFPTLNAKDFTETSAEKAHCVSCGMKG